ncbi:hypothetical protein [Teredinibacter franksiae]|uniref:hypothetical protein n=1 Tax=Teredinibacter franksiae TaxID=2761453 RepID=UPI00162A00E4|nr:hypothetical protein [Teredinibacter franksiae]
MKKLLSLAFLAALLPTLAFAANTSEGDSKNTFEFIKSKNFSKVLVDTKIDFSQYESIMYYPVNSEELSISKQVSLRLQKNWQNFHTEEWQEIAPITDAVTETVFSKNKVLKWAPSPKGPTLAFQVKLYELYPSAYLDNGLDTAGVEFLWNFAAVSYRIVVMDTKTKAMVAMFEDSLQVKPVTKARNNRASHKNAWKVSYQELLKDFEKDLERILKGKMKLAKK